jgi:cytochrome P450
MQLFSDAFKHDPYPAYRQLLAGNDVARVDLQGYSGLFVSRLEHVSALLRDSRMIQGERGNNWQPPEAWTPWFDMTGNWMLFRDPPAHTRLRGLVNQAFAPRAIQRMHRDITAIAQSLLDAAAARDTFDLIADYAFEVPVRVIAEMLGVSHEDHAQFHEWSRVLAHAIDFNLDDRFMNDAAATAREIDRYFRQLIEHKRSHPADDILSALIAAQDGGDRLSTEELIATVALLLFAGHETTVNLIGNGALAFMQHPAQRTKLLANPTLIGNAVEEILRYESPVQGTTRIAAEEIQVGADIVPQGRQVTLFMGAANRDPRANPDPDVFDITRKDIKHVAFGAGIHYCVGAPLARMEGQIALGTLFERFPELALGQKTLQWRKMSVLRGLQELWVYPGSRP